MSTTTWGTTASEPMSMIELLLECSIIAEGGGRATVHTFLPHPQDLVGWLGPAIDMVSGRAYNTVQSPDRTCITLSLRVDACAPVAASGELRLDGRVHYADDVSAVVHTVVRDSRERTVATAVSRFMTIPMPAFDPPGDVIPWRAQGVRLSDVLTPSFATGSAEGGTALFDPRAEFANPSGVLHGGVQLAMFDSALRAQAARILSADGALLDLTLEFLSPIPNDPGAPHRLVTETVRPGRRVAVVAGWLDDGTDNPATRARATFHTPN